MPSPQASSRIHQLLDEHWTAALDVDPSVWRDAEVVVASHPEPSHSDSVHLIRREDSCIIVVPEALVGTTTIACASWPSAAVFDRAFVRSLYGDEVTAIHGPHWLGYATDESFRRIDGRGSRRLDGPGHAVALAALRRRVPREEWVDAGFEVPGRRQYGCFVQSELVCAGTLTPFRGLLASVGVLTDPAHRGQGFGSAMVSALTGEALLDSRAAQFRALEDNRPALRIARVLGYVEDGRTFEVALRPAADTVSS
ncbi:MAG TPA: GNAT family N-acetyltransferase [Candidatus Dormibacteraeota bacterium]|nr:GNAT family N-acetyltransferase [Candidatus Dormibacteraeota bacterium]